MSSNGLGSHSKPGATGGDSSSTVDAGEPSQPGPSSQSPASYNAFSDRAVLQATIEAEASLPKIQRNGRIGHVDDKEQRRRSRMRDSQLYHMYVHQPRTKFTEAEFDQIKCEHGRRLWALRDDILSRMAE